MKSTSAALITFHIDSFFFSFLLQKRFHCWPVNINKITKIKLLFKHCNIHKKHWALSRASSSRDETGRGSCEVMRLFGFRHKHFSSPPSQWHCSSLAGDKLVVFTLCSSPSSAGGSAWARWGLKAPGWPWRGTSCPAAPPPPSGPRSTGPKAGRRTPGSAGSCSCRLRTLCCQPPEEKHQGHRPSENSHRSRTFHKKFSVFLVPGGFLYWCWRLKMTTGAHEDVVVDWKLIKPKVWVCLPPQSHACHQHNIPNYSDVWMMCVEWKLSQD